MKGVFGFSWMHPFFLCLSVVQEVACITWICVAFSLYDKPAVVSSCRWTSDMPGLGINRHRDILLLYKWLFDNKLNKCIHGVDSAGGRTPFRSWTDSFPDKGGKESVFGLPLRRPSHGYDLVWGNVEFQCLLVDKVWNDSSCFSQFGPFMTEVKKKTCMLKISFKERKRVGNSVRYGKYIIFAFQVD